MMSTDLSDIPIGTIAKRHEVGLRGNHPVVLMACEDCGARRWVLTQFRSPACRKCSTQRTGLKNRGKKIDRVHKADCGCRRCLMGAGLLVGPANTSWRGGISHTSGGYIEIHKSLCGSMATMCRSDGYAMEHRIVMAHHIGRPLYAWEYVHHRNGTKDDNRIENLELWIRPHPSGHRASEHHCPGCRCFEGGQS